MESHSLFLKQNFKPFIFFLGVCFPSKLCYLLVSLLKIMQPNIDLFAAGPATSAAGSSTMDFFASPAPVPVPETKSTSTGSLGVNSVDPFAAVPLNRFDQSDLFGAFTSSQANQPSSKPSENPINSGITNDLMGKSSAESKAPPKKDGFQVKSGIWADSLSRGLIDLNISARKSHQSP